MGMDEARALVHALCSCSVSLVSPPQLHAWLLRNDLFFISLHLLCMGMDEARALVRALWNSSASHVSILCSMFQWLDGVAQRRRAYANNAMVLYKIKLFCCKKLATSTLVYEV